MKFCLTTALIVFCFSSFASERFSYPKVRPPRDEECVVIKNSLRLKAQKKADASPVINGELGAIKIVRGDLRGDVRVSGESELTDVKAEGKAVISSAKLNLVKIYPKNWQTNPGVVINYSLCDTFEDLIVSNSEIHGDVKINACGKIEVTPMSGDISVSGKIDIGYSSLMANEDGTSDPLTINGDGDRGVRMGSASICNNPLIKGDLGIYIAQVKDNGKYVGYDTYDLYGVALESGLVVGPFVGANDFKGHFALSSRMEDVIVDGGSFCTPDNYCLRVTVDGQSKVGKGATLKGLIQVIFGGEVGPDTYLEGMDGGPGYIRIPGVNVGIGSSFIGPEKEMTGLVSLNYGSKVVDSNLKGVANLNGQFSLWIENNSTITNSSIIEGSAWIRNSTITGTEMNVVGGSITDATLNQGSVTSTSSISICGRTWPSGYEFVQGGNYPCSGPPTYEK